MSKFEEYRDKYQYIKMERSEGILQMTFHSKGKELLWAGGRMKRRRTLSTR